MSGAIAQQQSIGSLLARSSDAAVYREPYPYVAPYFPTLLYGPEPTAYDTKPLPWQVMDEGNRYWYRGIGQYSEEYYRTCGPIAVAHAVNFSRAAMMGGDSFETWNIADSIDHCAAWGAYERGNQTVVTGALRAVIEDATGLDCATGSYGCFDFDMAYQMALTRWILVNIPGHISLVVADPDRNDLRLVQYQVSAGPLPGRFDANDMHIGPDEWPSWQQYVCWPDQRLWAAPGEYRS